MIDQGDQRVGDWISSIINDVEITFAPPSEPVTEKPSVSIYLYDLLPASVTRNNTRTPSLQLQLRYLITTAAQDSLKAHQLLGELVFAAMEHDEFQVDLEPLPAAAWAALKVAPMPGFLLRTHLHRTREQSVPIVRKTMDIDSSPIEDVDGIVVGPGGLPIMNARVEFSPTGSVVRTDNKGRFHLAAIPSSSMASGQFVVQAKGRELSVSLKPKEMKNQPVVIHFDVMEA